MNPRRDNVNSVAYTRGKIEHHAIPRNSDNRGFHEYRSGNNFSRIETDIDYKSPYNPRNNVNYILPPKPAKNFIAECCESISNLFFGPSNTQTTQRRRRMELEGDPLLGRRRSVVYGGKGTRKSRRVSIVEIVKFLNTHPEIKMMIMEESCPLNKSEKMLSDAQKMIRLIEQYDTNISLDELKQQIMNNGSGISSRSRIGSRSRSLTRSLSRIGSLSRSLSQKKTY